MAPAYFKEERDKGSKISKVNICGRKDKKVYNREWYKIGRCKWRVCGRGKLSESGELIVEIYTILEDIYIIFI